MKRIVGNDAARFASRMVLVGDCWLWTGQVDRRGYGRTSMARKTWQAHRAVYALLVGPIPDGLQLDHLCRTPPCVNPSHLEPVTQQTNTLRSPTALAALNARKTHCKRGHEFTPENTYARPGGKRVCRLCNNEAARQYRQRLGSWS